MYNYELFRKGMTNYKMQLENSGIESDKRVVEAVKDFLEALDSMNKLNREEENKFLQLVAASLDESFKK